MKFLREISYRRVKLSKKISRAGFFGLAGRHARGKKSEAKDAVRDEKRSANETLSRGDAFKAGALADQARGCDSR
ncbi:hypothetical protein [Aliiruegeria lutimaris]|uniref:hypothetical protein n=1 Tax=Aliiruegeria lutimaris TaxID=571298 RepID=UPI0011145B35|nr:hypothetical protein [Aliiruegeria lutimaris]